MINRCNEFEPVWCGGKEACWSVWMSQASGHCAELDQSHLAWPVSRAWNKLVASQQVCVWVEKENCNIFLIHNASTEDLDELNKPYRYVNCKDFFSVSRVSGEFKRCGNASIHVQLYFIIGNVCICTDLRVSIAIRLPTTDNRRQSPLTPILIHSKEINVSFTVRHDEFCLRLNSTVRVSCASLRRNFLTKLAPKATGPQWNCPFIVTMCTI